MTRISKHSPLNVVVNGGRRVKVDPGLARDEGPCRPSSGALTAQAGETKNSHIMSLPPSVNFHINVACNFACRYCYATFEDIACEGRHPLSRAAAEKLVRTLAEAGFAKITFAGGEPTLVRWLPQLVKLAKRLGLVTMLVTNGSLLFPDHLRALADTLDWLVLSLDAPDAETNALIGRRWRGGAPINALHYLSLGRAAQSCGIRLKVNTVVNRLNHQVDLVEMIQTLKPERWKVLQAMRVDGQNDAEIAPLQVSLSEYNAFIARHRPVTEAGVTLVAEDATLIRGSYAMIDPAGRFFDSTKGHHTYSDPILSVGVHTAFQQVSFDPALFEARGGRYDF